MTCKTIFPSLLSCLIILSVAVNCHAGISVINGLTHLYDVQPGSLQKGYIEIQNNGKEAQAVNIYLQDYRFHHEGETYYEEPGSHPRSNAGWIDISPTYFLLQPNEKTTVMYEIIVPDTDTLIGTFWSVIMVQGEVPVDTNTFKKGININTQLRYAVQVATTFENSGSSNLTFYDVVFKKDLDQKMIMIDIGNDGQRILRPVVSVELFDQDGNSIEALVASKKKIYPQTSTRFLLDVKQIPPGSYQALVIADCSHDEVFGINVPLSIPGD